MNTPFLWSILQERCPTVPSGNVYNLPIQREHWSLVAWKQNHLHRCQETQQSNSCFPDREFKNQQCIFTRTIWNLRSDQFVSDCNFWHYACSGGQNPILCSSHSFEILGWTLAQLPWPVLESPSLERFTGHGDVASGHRHGLGVALGSAVGLAGLNELRGLFQP